MHVDVHEAVAKRRHLHRRCDGKRDVLYGALLYGIGGYNVVPPGTQPCCRTRAHTQKNTRRMAVLNEAVH